MKKSLLLLSTLALSAFLVSCGGEPETPSSSTPSVPSSSSKAEPQPGDYEYQEPLGAVDLSSLENELIIHYKMEKEDTARDCYKGWRAWIWADGKNGEEYRPNGIDEYGSIYHYSLSDLTGLTENFASTKIGFIIKTLGSGSAWNGSVTKDIDGDRFVDLTTLSPDANGNYQIWLQSGIETIYAAAPTSRDALGTVYFYDEKGVTKMFLSTKAGSVAKVSLMKDGEPIQNWELSSPTSGKSFDLDVAPALSSLYSVHATFETGVEIDAEVSFYPLFRTSAFKEAYDYDGPLGVEVTESQTTFRVWSPMSSEISVRVYGSGTPKSVDPENGDDNILHEIPMEKGEKGVFSATINECLYDRYYTFVVTNGHYKAKEIVDPYAKSAGVNGLRGLIVDFSKTNPEGWADIGISAYDRKNLTVYETHVSDVTHSPTWKGSEANKAKYLGLKEEGTKYEEGGKSTPTGFDYIKDLGVNAVQLQPIFDQANDEITGEFNWGYNPLNYNCLEGIYSSDPHDGYARIKEFKEVIASYAKAGINIIMDVVYNHVNSANGSNFDVLMPGYYFRSANAGASLSNGSGCGNELASENTMVRRFIVESTEFWAKEYKLGGFRFDLMALEDLTTMNQVAANLKTINENIVVYGEPWAGGTTTLLSTEQASQANGNLYEGYGQFNDGMRDALIKGGMKGTQEIGFADAKDGLESSVSDADLNAIVAGLAGHTRSTGTILDSSKTVNYVTCHDNYTLNDRFEAVAKAQTELGNALEYTAEEKKGMNVLANSFVFASQGTSFFLAGEECLRTKGGHGNTYGGDALTAELESQGYSSWAQVNEMDYSLAIQNADMVAAYKTMIAFKKSNPDFAQATSGTNNPVSVVSKEKGMIVVDVQGRSKAYRMAFRNGLAGAPMVDFSGFDLEWSTGVSPEIGAKTAIAPYQTIVASKAK